MLVLALRSRLESNEWELCPLLRPEESPLPEGTPNGKKHRGPIGSPKDMRSVVPGAPVKVLVPGRDWGSGRDVGERLGPAWGAEDAPEVSCLVRKKGSVVMPVVDKLMLVAVFLPCPQQRPQPATRCQGLPPKLHFFVPLLCSMIKQRWAPYS